MSVLDRIHGGYVYGRRVRVLSEHLARLIPPGARVLDVGCGDGLVDHLIVGMRPDLEIQGIDTLARARSHIPVVTFDGRALPYPPASFDAVMFVDVIHHCDEPLALLREAVRVSRRVLVIKDHTLDGFLAGETLRWMDWIGNARYGVSLPYRYWPERKWLETFAELGLTVGHWQRDLKLYLWPADWIFGRSLHFIARLEHKKSPDVGLGGGRDED